MRLRRTRRPGPDGVTKVESSLGLLGKEAWQWEARNRFCGALVGMVNIFTFCSELNEKMLGQFGQRNNMF